MEISQVTPKSRKELVVQTQNCCSRRDTSPISVHFRLLKPKDGTFVMLPTQQACELLSIFSPQEQIQNDENSEHLPIISTAAHGYRMKNYEQPVHGLPKVTAVAPTHELPHLTTSAA